MRLVEVRPEKLVVIPELSRSGSVKQFEDRLRASIDEMGLAEPLKVAPLSDGHYLVVDGTMRLKAITRLREVDPSRFSTVPAYMVKYDSRYELRYQTDIYQDLLPSQLANLVEHFHQTEHVRKVDIARYIGVSPATLRNYTGLWRLLQRGGLFAKLVELMDLGVLPSSNPYAWQRLTPTGLRFVIETSFSGGEDVETWLSTCAQRARQGHITHYPLKFVEAATDGLAPEFYREDEEVRTVKRDLGLRRATKAQPKIAKDVTGALQHLGAVASKTRDPVLRSAAKSLRSYLA